MERIVTLQTYRHHPMNESTVSIWKMYICKHNDSCTGIYNLKVLVTFCTDGTTWNSKSVGGESVGLEYINTEEKVLKYSWNSMLPYYVIMHSDMVVHLWTTKMLDMYWT